MTDSQGHRVTEAARIPSRRRSGAVLGVVLALAVAAGCSGSSGSSSGSSDKAANKLAPSAAAAARGPARPGAAAGRTAPPSTRLQQRDIVRTATVELHTRDVNHAADTIVALADPAGGRVDGDGQTHRLLAARHRRRRACRRDLRRILAAAPAGRRGRTQSRILVVTSAMEASSSPGSFGPSGS